MVGRRRGIAVALALTTLGSLALMEQAGSAVARPAPLTSAAAPVPATPAQVLPAVATPTQSLNQADAGLTAAVANLAAVNASIGDAPSPAQLAQVGQALAAATAQADAADAALAATVPAAAPGDICACAAERASVQRHRATVHAANVRLRAAIRDAAFALRQAIKACVTPGPACRAAKSHLNGAIRRVQAATVFVSVALATLAQAQARLAACIAAHPKPICRPPS
jgi:hypothetical protein